MLDRLFVLAVPWSSVSRTPDCSRRQSGRAFLRRDTPLTSGPGLLRLAGAARRDALSIVELYPAEPSGRSYETVDPSALDRGRPLSHHRRRVRSRRCGARSR